MAELEELESKLNKLLEDRENDQETIESLKADHDKDRETIESLRAELKSFKREADPTTQIYEVLQDKKRSPAEEALINDVESAAKSAIEARVKKILYWAGIPTVVLGGAYVAIIVFAYSNAKATVVNAGNEAVRESLKVMEESVKKAEESERELSIKTKSMIDMIDFLKNQNDKEVKSISDERENLRNLIRQADSNLSLLRERGVEISKVTKNIDKFKGEIDKAIKEAIKVKTTSELLKAVNSALPVGSVVAYAGDSPPQNGNWRICDGSLIDNSSGNYKALWEALEKGKFYGGVEDSFNLPDYQGYFLRGVSKTKEQDPDRDSRKGRSLVGSTQEDAIKSHSHDIRTDGFETHKHERAGTPLRHGRHDFHSKDSGNKKHGYHTDRAGGSETRPKNVYVHWIIKVK